MRLLGTIVLHTICSGRNPARQQAALLQFLLQLLMQRDAWFRLVQYALRDAVLFDCLDPVLILELLHAHPDSN